MGAEDLTDEAGGVRWGGNPRERGFLPWQLRLLWFSWALKTDIPQAVLEVALVRLEAGSARNLVGKPILLTFPALKFQGAQAHL